MSTRQKIWSICLLVVFVAVLIGGTSAYSKEPVKKIKIGVIGPMKFSAGKHEWWGAQMAAEEINLAGGIRIKGVKHEIELVQADSNEILSMTDAVTAMERLITVDKVNFVTGGYLTEPTMAMQEVVADNRIIYIGGAGSPELTARLAKNYDRYKYYFRAIHINSAIMVQINFILIDMIGNKVKTELGIAKPRIAFLLDKIKVGDPIVEIGRDLIPKLGMELAGVWRTSPRATDYSPELAAIKDSGAHAIVTFFAGPSGIIFSKQWGELKIPAVPAGMNMEAYEKAYWSKTAGMCEYETIYNNFGPVEITAKSMPFYKKYLERTGEYPTPMAGAYDGLYILKDAIERANTLETESVLLALEKVNYTGVCGKYAFYPRDHKWPHDLIWGPDHVIFPGLQWRDGKLLVVWPDGRAALGDEKWKGVRFKGTVEYQLPPWMVEYWKGRK
jgi:branched-chain amino acid transport system substrate-binding protein